MLKKAVIISLLIFWTIFVAVLSAGLASNQQNRLFAGNAPAGASQTADSAALAQRQQQLVQASGRDITLNLAEISKHRASGDCWLLISGKVYNVTSYLSQHPGGAATILPTCGTDATNDYATKDRAASSGHSSYANSLLAAYYIGDFNQILSQQKITAEVQKTNSANTGSGGAANPALPAPGVQPPASAGSAQLTLSEIVKHNSASDCWLLISNKVYNLTSYIGSHPGGAMEIIKFCGTDATVAFQTKDNRGNNHSSYAYSLLTAYYIGDLNQNVTTQQLNTSVQQTNTVPPPAGNGEYDD